MGYGWIWFKECNREASRLQKYHFGHPQQKMSCDQLNKMLQRPSLEKNASGDRFLVGMQSAQND